MHGRAHMPAGTGRQTQHLKRYLSVCWRVRCAQSEKKKGRVRHPQSLGLQEPWGQQGGGRDPGPVLSQLREEGNQDAGGRKPGEVGERHEHRAHGSPGAAILGDECPAPRIRK